MSDAGPPGRPAAEPPDSPSPWSAWGALATRPWRHTFALAGAERLSEATSLEHAPDGVYTYAREQVWRTPTGLFLLLRAERSAPDGPEALTAVLGADPDQLVVAVRGQLGVTPGRVELLGEAGIEIGLEPGGVEEGD